MMEKQRMEASRLYNDFEEVAESIEQGAMMPREGTETQAVAKPCLTLLATRAVVVILLFTVAGLATLAKNGQYYPKSNPARNVSISTKMNVTHGPVQVAAEPSQHFARFYLPQPPLRVIRARDEQVLQKPPVGVMVSMQHRSPPVVLS
jgi:hypothetical protein